MAQSLTDAAQPRDLGVLAHYEAFLRGPQAPPRSLSDQRERVVLVHGNCQAGSVRVLLSEPGVHAVRMPPAHEMLPGDVEVLGRWLAVCDALVSQPIRENYRGLPIGTAQLADGLRPGVPVVTMPVVRWAGPYPHQVIVRSPRDPSLVPPVVAYHDLRTIVAALARRDGGRARGAPLTAAALDAGVAESLGQLRRREEAADTVVISDVLEAGGDLLAHTINHPANPVLIALADRIRARLGLRPSPPVDRELLHAVSAPLAPEVVEHFELAHEPSTDWTLRTGIGEDAVARTVPDAEVVDAQLAWYADHPEFLDAALSRHAERLRFLGLTW